MIDGEAVVLGVDGVADFNALHSRKHEALIEIFSHGNMPYLLIATAARLLLEGNEIGTSRSISTPSRHGPAAGGSLVLMEPHHAERQLQDLYEDLKSTLGLPFLNTDYRALARWPSYFDVAWRSLKPLIGTPAYDERWREFTKKLWLWCSRCPIRDS